jgi:hypothetical protein
VHAARSCLAEGKPRADQRCVLVSDRAPRPSEITPEAAYVSRRESWRLPQASCCQSRRSRCWPRRSPAARRSSSGAISTDEPNNSYEDITTYNNFYEFGTGKSDPATHSSKFRPTRSRGSDALLLLIPLAVTSTAGWMRRLGRRWQRLRRLIYPAAILGCVHYWWQVKADVREPLIYATVLLLLLRWRVHRARASPRAPARSRG